MMPDQIISTRLANNLVARAQLKTDAIRRGSASLPAMVTDHDVWRADARAAWRQLFQADRDRVTKAQTALANALTAALANRGKQ